LLSAIGDIAKARGMSKIATETGLGRESLYKALNPDSKPRFETVIKVLGALGVDLKINARIKKPGRLKRIKRQTRFQKRKLPVLKT